MARYAPGYWRPLGEQTQPKMTSHDVICVHTMVGSLTGTYGMFRRGRYGGLESHFGVGGIWGADSRRRLDGVVYQFQDTAYTADANLDGNPYILSIETADNDPANPDNLEPWTTKQILAISQLIAWLCRTYNIPPRLIPNSRRGNRGIAYHRQGIDPWRVTGGDKWSSAYGKICPGQIRINQLTNVIIPAVQHILNPPPAPPTPTPLDVFTMDPADFLHMLWNNNIGTLTPDDAAAINLSLPPGGVPAKAGDPYNLSQMLRRPTSVRQLANVVAINDTAITTVVTQMQAATAATLSDVQARIAAIEARLGI